MRTTVLPLITSFIAALIVGAVSLSLFVIGLLDYVPVSRDDYVSPTVYALLPAVLSWGFSMAFAHWALAAARVFLIVWSVVFFVPTLLLVAVWGRLGHWGELVLFTATAILSFLTGWYTASLVRRQLEKAQSDARSRDMATS